MFLNCCKHLQTFWGRKMIADNNDDDWDGEDVVEAYDDDGEG